MKELISSSDLVKISYIQSLLLGEGIESFVLDEHMSAFYGGALMPRRIMVHDDDWSRADYLIKTSNEIER